MSSFVIKDLLYFKALELFPIVGFKRWQGYRHGLKFEKVGSTFSSFNAMLAKIAQKLLWLVFLGKNLFDIFFINSTGVFCVWEKAPRNDFSTKLT